MLNLAYPVAVSHHTCYTTTYLRRNIILHRGETETVNILRSTYLGGSLTCNVEVFFGCVIHDVAKICHKF